MTEVLVAKLGYVGIALLLVLGGLGLPVPEEAPIILAAVLSKNERMWWPLALASCFIGVLLGDFVVYFLGYFHGEKVLSLRLTRSFLTRAREAQIKGYFHRHGFKILILGRFAVGFRTAAYLTAGILKLPFLKLFVTDVFAASLSTLLMFGLGYVFAHQIEASFDKLKHWLFATVAVVLCGWLLYRYYKGRRRAGMLVGPPVLLAEELPLLPPVPRVASEPANQHKKNDPPVAAELIEVPPAGQGDGSSLNVADGFKASPLPAFPDSLPNDLPVAAMETGEPQTFEPHSLGIDPSDPIPLGGAGPRGESGSSQRLR